MNAIVDSLTAIHPGEPRQYRNLWVFPLLGEGPAEPDYLLLEEALEQGLARVGEASEDGRVPELEVVNDALRPVLLLDGEELLGAKQNRILNLSVLAPPRQRTLIPVSCVEAGRWHPNSATFSASGRTHFASGRARTASSVSQSLLRERTRKSDQQAVWAAIAAKSARLQVRSPTAAAAALYEANRAGLGEFQQAFTASAQQVGAIFAINGAPVGLELFDSPRTLARSLAKLVQGYALDALDTTPQDAAPVPSAAADLLAAVGAAGIQRFPAVGLGEDLRLSGAGVTGGALVLDGRVVHLCAFRAPETAFQGPTSPPS